MNADRSNTRFPPATMARNFRELQQDVLALLRLQLELMHIDMEQWRREIAAPLILLGIAAAMALGAVPVVLFGVAQALQSLTGMALSLEIVAFSGLTISAVAAYYGWQRVRRASRVFRRSQEELQRNLQWLKELLAQDRSPSGEPAANGADR